MILGASVYEHLAVWPNAFAAPPKSLTMFQGDFKLSPDLFWKSIHPITLFLFIVYLILNWKSERKKYILDRIGIMFLRCFPFAKNQFKRNRGKE